MLVKKAVSRRLFLFGVTPMKLFISLIVLTLWTATAYAGLYKWVDAQGKVHYSDQPASGNVKSEKKLDIQNHSAPAPAASTNKSWQEKNLEYKKRQSSAADADAKKQKEAEDAKAKTENCDKAKKNLQTLEDGVRIYSYDDKGERSAMDDAQRTKAKIDARKAVSDWCK
jgi:hypothetical protein